MYWYRYKLAAPIKEKRFLVPLLSREYTNPPVTKSRLWGSFWDVDRHQIQIVDPINKNNFVLAMSKKRPKTAGKSSLWLSVRNFGSARSKSIERGQISREGALDHRESRERRDKIFAAKTENDAKIFKRKLDQENSFQWGIFNFLAAGTLTILGWGYNFNTG